MGGISRCTLFACLGWVFSFALDAAGQSVPSTSQDPCWGVSCSQLGKCILVTDPCNSGQCPSRPTCVCDLGYAHLAGSELACVPDTSVECVSDEDCSSRAECLGGECIPVTGAIPKVRSGRGIWIPGLVLIGLGLGIPLIISFAALIEALPGTGASIPCRAVGVAWGVGGGVAVLGLVLLVAGMSVRGSVKQSLLHGPQRALSPHFIIGPSGFSLGFTAII